MERVKILMQVPEYVTSDSVDIKRDVGNFIYDIHRIFTELKELIKEVSNYSSKYNGIIANRVFEILNSGSEKLDYATTRKIPYLYSINIFILQNILTLSSDDKKRVLKRLNRLNPSIDFYNKLNYQLSEIENIRNKLGIDKGFLFSKFINDEDYEKYKEDKINEIKDFTSYLRKTANSNVKLDIVKIDEIDYIPILVDRIYMFENRAINNKDYIRLLIKDLVNYVYKKHENEKTIIKYLATLYLDLK